jgi:hypothetical protein
MRKEGTVISQKMRLLSTIGLALAITVPAIAAIPSQTEKELAAEASEDSSTITVTGRKEEKREIKLKARSFAGTVMKPVLGQYSRRETPICPLVIGIDQSYHEIIYAKFREVANRIGAKIAENKCKTNSFIIFSEDGVDTLATLKKERPPLFAEVPVNERSLFKESAPARWWYRTEVRDSEGRTFSGGLSRNSEDFPSIQASTSAESLIYSTVQINLLASFVLIDLKKAEGYPLEAIAAHAAMVSMVQVKPGKDFEAVPSILNIFAPGKLASDAPTEPTRWDYAFAQSIYEIKARQSGAAQKSELAQRIAAKLSE